MNLTQAELKLREAVAFSQYAIVEKPINDDQTDPLDTWRATPSLRAYWRIEADRLQEQLAVAGLKITYTESKKTDKLIADLLTHPARTAYELGNE